VLTTKPIPDLKEGEVLVKMSDACDDHREVWIRMGLYPRILIGSTFGADGAGIVIASSDPYDTHLNKRVFLSPFRGWIDDPDGPEPEYV